MKNDGKNKVSFPHVNQEVVFNYPNTKISGIMWGSKTISVEGTMTFEDEANGLKAVLFFQKQAFSGLCYQRDPSKVPGAPTKLA